eukprot:5473983-Pleurochrysis_carterae.AAC.2
MAHQMQAMQEQMQTQMQAQMQQANAQMQAQLLKERSQQQELTRQVQCIDSSQPEPASTRAPAPVIMPKNAATAEHGCTERVHVPYNFHRFSCWRVKQLHTA